MGEVHREGGHGLNIRCPHCHNALEVLLDDPLTDVVCPSCGSHFSLIDGQSTVSLSTHSRTIAHFELLERLGAGRFGVVWKARDVKLDRMVAVKIPRSIQLPSEEIDEFIREARAAAQLRHPNIVSVHEVGRDNEVVYIVSEYIDGASLQEYLKTRRIPANDAAAICATLANALHHAHERGVIHRDLKPANILLDERGQPHIADFGLAKRESNEITMTVDGKILGTPAYMSPEQASGKGHDADRRSDVYSLGVILFELLTGELPFRGEKRMLIMQVIHDAPPDPRKLDSSVPRNLETICLKCLRKLPGQRYFTAQDLAADLQRHLNNEPIKARRVTVAEKLWLWCRRHPALSSAAAAILLMAVTTQLYVLHSHRTNERLRAHSLVDSLLSARAEAVPYAIKALEPIRNQSLPFLQRWMQDPELTEESHLRAAAALAHFGQPQHGFLISSIRTAPSAESANIVNALVSGSKDALSVLDQNAKDAEKLADWPLKARLAIVALQLGDPRLALDMCQSRVDPVQRTTFTDVCTTWSGQNEAFIKAAKNISQPELRSDICRIIGGRSLTEITSIEKRDWQQLLEDWFKTATDSETHSAADWALRRWNLPLPLVERQSNPVEKKAWYVNSIGMTLVKVSPGSFVRPRAANKPEKTTFTITRPYYLSDREVSVAQYRLFVTATGALPNYDHDFALTDAHPMNSASWIEAAQFCNWLSEKEGLPACFKQTGEKFKIKVGATELEREIWECNYDASGYRLPTEAEWELACRAGTTTPWCSGNEQSRLSSHAVFWSQHPEPCGSKLPNAFGLFDMHGNILEWCWDWYGEYGSEAELSDPRGPDRGARRVLRGGVFNGKASTVSSSERYSHFPNVRFNIMGFRPARTVP